MNRARVEDIQKRYAIKSENAFRTYQDTGKSIYDWFYREYDDISRLATMSLDANDTANTLASMRVFLSDFVDRLNRPDADLDQIRKDVTAYARLLGIVR